MEGVLKTMMTTKLMLLTTTVLVAGLVTTGAGVAAYSALGRDDGLRGARAESRPGESPRNRKRAHRLPSRQRLGLYRPRLLLTR